MAPVQMAVPVVVALAHVASVVVAENGDEVKISENLTENKGDVVMATASELVKSAPQPKTSSSSTAF